MKMQQLLLDGENNSQGGELLEIQTTIYIIQLTDPIGKELDLLPKAFFSERKAIEYLQALNPFASIEQAPWSKTCYEIRLTGKYTNDFYAHIKELTIGD